MKNAKSLILRKKCNGVFSVLEPQEEEVQRLLRAFAVLARNTTWKCGRVERLVVGYLWAQLTNFGHVRLPVREMLLHFKLNGKKKNNKNRDIVN